MRCEIKYVAFDETRFNTKRECVVYEGKCLDYLYLFSCAYEFYDANYTRIKIPFDNINEAITALNRAYEDCFFVTVRFVPPNDVMDFIVDQVGAWYLPLKEGTYKYDEDMGEWVIYV